MLPTVFDLAGLETPATNQGRSFASYVTRGAVCPPYERREYVFSEDIIPEVITHGRLDYPYVPGKGVGGIQRPDAKMVRSARWKYNYYVGHGDELYDLDANPLEKRSLADEPACAEVAARMRRVLLDWQIAADERDQIVPRWSEV